MRNRILLSILLIAAIPGLNFYLYQVFVPEHATELALQQMNEDGSRETLRAIEQISIRIDIGLIFLGFNFRLAVRLNHRILNLVMGEQWHTPRKVRRSPSTGWPKNWTASNASTVLPPNFGPPFWNGRPALRVPEPFAARQGSGRGFLENLIVWPSEETGFLKSAKFQSRWGGDGAFSDFG